MQEDDRLKARRTFVERHRHVLGGMVLDGISGRHGGDLALWTRQIFHKVDAQLAGYFDELLPPASTPLVLTEAEKAKLAAEKKGPVR